MRNSLRLERAKLKITQQELADRLHVSRQTINSIETNRYVPSTLLALKIAKELKMSVEKLFELEADD